MINFNQIRVFYEAARCQNFSQAARNLCVTQPAITGQIRALEEQVEIKLFKKRGRRMALSEAGAILFQHAHEVFELEKRMEKVLGEMRELKRGLLKIGTTKTYARYLMPSLVSRYRAAYPDIKIILDEGSSAEVSRSLQDLRNELAIIAFTEDVRGVKLLPFRQEQVVLFAAPTHPLAQREGIGIEDLEGQLIIMKEEGSSTHAVVRQYFEKNGRSPNVLVETSNVGFIKEMVEKGEGVAFLVQSAIEEEVAAGRVKVVPIVDEPLTLEVHIAYLEEGDLSPAAKAFLKILEDEKVLQGTGRATAGRSRAPDGRP
ncbi:MAG: LysR family transcriptional regulator [Deltaproteobacteria bacterium]|nr:LysR family transcriptional regulator [Deltaproteobacteria bacterium]